MSRDFFINGETLVKVKGNSNSAIGSLSELGLAVDAIRVSITEHHEPLNVDAWGKGIVDKQFMLAEATINMNLIHFDRTVLDVVLAESFAVTGTVGTFPRAGTRMGGGNARFAPGNHWMGLNLLSPVGNKPWRFYYAALMGQPMAFPLGTEKSIVQLLWQAIPYTTDPWNGGSGASGTVLWDYTLDT